MKLSKQSIALLPVYLYCVSKCKTQDNNKEFCNKAIVQEEKYYENLRKIDVLLLNLTKEVLGNKDAAVIQNTFLDLRQEWLFQDVLTRTTKNKKIQSGYCPSDSLATIYHLLFPKYDPSNKEKLISEIKKIKIKISPY
ncbi:hypothetical protein ACO2Q8_13220 [Larkinella sp. VNQ87]|uniref:hypothetical protein n=1 Tax=Larkinella sp. VNQ87 TaxID=3400921 RepID=UPI003C0D93A4